MIINNMSEPRTKENLTSEVISEIDKDDSASEESDNEKAVDKVKISKEFQENVVKFVKLDDLVRKKQSEMADLKEQRKPCEQYILKYLDKIEESTIAITNGKLRKNKSETKSALSQDVIKSAIEEKVKDVKLVDEILNLMETMRPTNTHVNLKRTHTRMKRVKKDISKENDKDEVEDKEKNNKENENGNENENDDKVENDF